MATDHQQDTFLEMLRQCRGTLHKACLVFGGPDREEIRDLYQDIVCQLWQEWPSFRGESAVNTWVASIAYNTGASHLRKKYHSPTLVRMDEQYYDTLAAETADPCIERLHDLVESLDRQQDRELVCLYLDHMPMRDIAAALGISEVAVRQRLHRIKKKIITLNKQEYL